MAGIKDVSLTDIEKRVVKALLAKGSRNQDIQALLNIGRKATINSGRISGIKKNNKVVPATDEEVAAFEAKKRSYDPATNLNTIDDERLVRAREAMILAVRTFNSPGVKFKTEMFTVLATIAWTYLLHEFYLCKDGNIMREDGKSLALSDMIERADTPVSDAIRNNLRALKLLRDKVEHLLLGQADDRWFRIFQASCVNFDKTLCALFGNRLTLSSDLSLALQFAKMDLEQLAAQQDHALPPRIAALDAMLTEGMTEEQINDVEFQFRVVYTLDASAKAQSHFQFVSPTSAAGKEIHNVLAKKVSGDELYPHKPHAVTTLVAQRTGKKFTLHNHQQAYRLHNVRPKAGQEPQNTDKRYCMYHPAHKDYTYSNEWVDRLVAEVLDEAKFSKIVAKKL